MSEAIEQVVDSPGAGTPVTSAPNVADGPRVCLIVSSFRPVFGGTERRTERLAISLLKQGVEVVVLTRRYPDLNRSERFKGLPVHRLGYPSKSKAGAVSFALHVLWSLATRFRRFRIVHVQNPDTPLLIGFLARLFLRRKLVVTVNSDPAIVLGRARPTGSLRFRMTRLLADAVGALSEEMADALAANGMPGTRVHVLPSGVDTEVFRPANDTHRERSRARLGLDRDVFVGLFVGRLAHVKRVDVLIRAWAGLSMNGRPRTLLIVGDGPERPSLEALTFELGVSDVRFELRTNDVSQYLHAADAFILPSEREGLSSALLEAMASGLPAVVSDLWGNRALVADGYSGLTFPVGDISALTKRLAALESVDVRQRLGRGAEQVAQRYSIHRTAKLHRDLYIALGGRAGSI